MAANCCNDELVEGELFNVTVNRSLSSCACNKFKTENELRAFARNERQFPGNSRDGNMTLKITTDSLSARRLLLLLLCLLFRYSLNDSANANRFEIAFVPLLLYITR